jgi:hypothetical protein
MIGGKMKIKRLLLVSLTCALLLLVLAPGQTVTRLVSAQRTSSNLSVRVSPDDASYQSIRQRPVMVSAIRDGAVIKQVEVNLNSTARFVLPAGLYDVRLEGDGMETLVKRGIHVQAEEDTQVIGGPIRAGTGVKIVEYAVGGLSREEIAARLARLESAIAELQKKTR